MPRPVKIVTDVRIHLDPGRLDFIHIHRRHPDMRLLSKPDDTLQAHCGVTTEVVQPFRIQYHENGTDHSVRIGFTEEAKKALFPLLESYECYQEEYKALDGRNRALHTHIIDLQEATLEERRVRQSCEQRLTAIAGLSWWQRFKFLITGEHGQ